MDRAGKFKQGRKGFFREVGKAFFRGGGRSAPQSEEDWRVITVSRLRFLSPVANASTAWEPLAPDRSRRLRMFANLSALSAALLLALSLSAGSAAAQGHTRADEEACTPDVYRLCGDYVPNQSRIVSCLKAKRSRLSPACRTVMTRHTRRR